MIDKVENITTEYDEDLKSLLLQNNFTNKNILNLMITGITAVCADRSGIMFEVDRFKAEHKSGCIFTLPSERRDNTEWVFWTPMSKSEIYRRIALKAFL